MLAQTLNWTDVCPQYNLADTPNRKVPMRIAIACVLCLTITSFSGGTVTDARQVSAAPHPLTNQDVVRMTKARFDDATIVKTIETHTASFDLSVEALLNLKDVGVSQAVIQSMLSTAGGKKGFSTAPATLVGVPLKSSPADEIPEEVGVYQVLSGKLVAIEPEIVNWRTGGVVKNAVTLGLDKGHVNGTVAGPHSTFNVNSVPFGMAGPVEFYIRCLEGNSASEYQLLRFWEKNDRREFRSVTGGVLHASGGAEDNVIAFKFEKVAARTYKVDLPNLSMGEYGFLAPGAAASSDMASRGKVYTFRILE
jgi:FlaG/FlaF family flagellin (archaellin)